MNTLVGAEYVIANTLIALNKKGIESITFSKLREIGIQIQNICNDNGVDAVILTFGDSISSAIYDFSDYFQYREIKGEPSILIQTNATISDLQKRFVGYLPVDVLRILVNGIPKLVA